MTRAHHARASIAHLYHAAARRKRTVIEFLPELAVLIMSIATIAGLWIAINRYSAAELIRLETRLEQVSADLAIALTAKTEGTLETAKQAAALIARTYERNPADLNLSIWSGLHQMGTFPRASILDERGAVISTSTAEDLFDYTTLLPLRPGREAAPGQLLIGAPVPFSPGHWRIPAFMRISHADASFGGFVVVWISTESFDSVYRHAGLSPEDTMALVSTDGTVQAQFGRPISAEDRHSGYLHKILMSADGAGTFISLAPGDGAGAGTKALITAHRAIEGYPLIAIVSLDYDNAFTAFYARAHTYDEVAEAVSIVVTLLAAGLLLTLSKQRATAHTLQTRLAEEALHDALTGLANRSLFHDHCERAMSRARRHAYRVAVLYLDLDDFKPINDRYGHAAGDLVLQEVSTRLQNCVRAASEDLVARLGGDEFCVILSDVDRAQCEVIVRKTLSALAAPMDLGGVRFKVTASIGTALFPDDAGDVATLINLADRGMYEAKRRGKNQFSWQLAARDPQKAENEPPGTEDARQLRKSAGC